MRTLLEGQNAYELADEARSSNDASTALDLISQAIDEQPRESLFHGIQGDVFASVGRHQDAVQSYTVASVLNRGYFGYFLGRGSSFDALGHVDRARNDFRASNRLLQTPFASFKLGSYAFAEGDRTEAKRQFEFASKEDGELGKAALDAYVRMDIEDAPGKYVNTEPLLENGQVSVKLSNSSGYPIRNIVVRVDVKINGEEVSKRLNLNRLDSGYYEVLKSSVHYRSEDHVQVRARVLGASVGR